MDKHIHDFQFSGSEPVGKGIWIFWEVCNVCGYKQERERKEITND